jgi:hypothetical protein
MKACIIYFILVLSFFLPGSVSYSGTFVRVEAGFAFSDNIYFTDFNIGYRIRFLNIISETYCGTRTWAYYQRGAINGQPFDDVYSIGQFFRYNGVFIHAKHHCSHRVVSGADQTCANSADYWNGDISTVSIGYEFELR